MRREQEWTQEDQCTLHLRNIRRAEVLTRVRKSELELELRLQQFIELARCGDIDKLMDAIGHARKHLAGDQSSKFGLRAGGLMAYPPDTFVEPYQVINRFAKLAGQS